MKSKKANNLKQVAEILSFLGSLLELSADICDDYLLQEEQEAHRAKCLAVLNRKQLGLGLTYFETQRLKELTNQ